MKYFEPNESLQGTDLPVFDMDMILRATDNFSNTNKLGAGGFGIVYKVLLAICFKAQMFSEEILMVHSFM